MTAIFDIETDGLYHEATTIHCISIKIDDNPTEVYSSRPITGSVGNIHNGIELLKQVDIIVGHNIINFDLSVIYKLTGVDLYKTCEVIDTLLISQLLYPNLVMMDTNRKTMPPKYKGKHGLMAWGFRLGKLKGDYGEQEQAWDKLTPEMVEYCRQDSEVTYALYQRFLQNMPPAEAIRIEQEFAKIISRQEKYGWKFDLEQAQKMHVELMSELEEAEKILFETFIPLKTWFPKSYPKIAVKKDGSKSQVLLNQEASGCHYNDEFEWGYYDEVTFNPGSGQHIVRWVEELYGKQKWRRNEPTERNPIGSPKTGADDILELFGDKDWAKPLTNYFNIKKLLGQLAEGKNSWINLVGDDGRMHGHVNTLGAVSRRATHNKPNVAQVPSPRAFKGKECRELFTSGEGKTLVGCDMSGLELRIFAHYLARHDEGQYANVILKEDIHTFNQKAFGVPTRDIAKTTIYGTLYGGGDARIGQIVSGTAKDGKRIKDNFKKNVPAYKQLIDGVARSVKKNGHVKALDGNPYFIRSTHSALNQLLQGAGSLVCKQWLIETDNELSKRYTNSWTAMHTDDEIQYEYTANVHDEFTNEVDEEIAKDVAKITEGCCQKAGEYFNLRIRLDGEAKIDRNWYGIH